MGDGTGPGGPRLTGRGPVKVIHYKYVDHDQKRLSDQKAQSEKEEEADELDIPPPITEGAVSLLPDKEN